MDDSAFDPNSFDIFDLVTSHLDDDTAQSRYGWLIERTSADPIVNAAAPIAIAADPIAIPADPIAIVMPSPTPAADARGPAPPPLSLSPPHGTPKRARLDPHTPSASASASASACSHPPSASASAPPSSDLGTAIRNRIDDNDFDENVITEADIGFIIDGINMFFPAILLDGCQNLFLSGGLNVGAAINTVESLRASVSPGAPAAFKIGITAEPMYRIQTCR